MVEAVKGLAGYICGLRGCQGVAKWCCREVKCCSSDDFDEVRE